jgi:ribosomal protein S18 acetylase RimI-like enzyme
MNLTIRPFVDTDLATLREILVASFDGVSIDQNIERQLGPIGEHDWRFRKGRHLDDDVRRDPAGIFVAELDGQIVGFISTWMDRASGVGFIPNMSVRAEERGKGVGRKLLDHALQHFRANGLSLARIETLDQNAIGRHLYPSLGFEEVARQIHFAMRLGGET